MITNEDKINNEIICRLDLAGRFLDAHDYCTFNSIIRGLKSILGFLYDTDSISRVNYLTFRHKVDELNDKYLEVISL